MSNQVVLKKYIKYLLNSAIERNTNQGIFVYEKVLEQLEGDLPYKDVNECLKMLIQALNGIEAHGFFTKEEADIVTSIRQMSDK